MADDSLKHRSKRYRERIKLVDRDKIYSVEEAVEVLKKIAATRYDETVALDFQLGIKPDQNDQMIRGTVSLPSGSGKNVRVLCFCKGEGATEAQEAGAEFVGAEDLVEKVQGGWLDFDAVVAHPDMMREVSKLGRILGPRGLMPTPKTGTVTPQVGKAVKELKAGRVEFKNDKTAGLHVACGKLSFSKEDLLVNVNTVIRAIRDAKPASSRGEYFRKVTIAASQGPGIRIAAQAV